MWAAAAAKLGFKWKIGNGRKVKFWEDNWLGPSSLAVQFWEIYVLVNEKSSTVSELWDGNDLKCTFRRGFDNRMMNVWLEIVQLASTITFSDDDDCLIWQFNSNGVYSSQSLYRIINFRGILPVHVPAVWDVKVPPRVQFFLWLLSKNKNLTRDNLNIRKRLEDLTCLFCAENETVHHLFFDCAVAKQMWAYMSEVFDREIGNDFLSIGQMWLSNRRYLVCNMFCAAALWGLWKLRNSVCFQGEVWMDLRMLLLRVAAMLQSWIILCPQEKRMEFSGRLGKLKGIALRPTRIAG